jgi:hypothetical protein
MKTMETVKIKLEKIIRKKAVAFMERTNKNEDDNKTTDGWALWYYTKADNDFFVGWIVKNMCSDTVISIAKEHNYEALINSRYIYFYKD